MKKHKHITLKRELGLIETTMCGVGIILGAGIYALVGKAAGIAGNAVWISFLLGAIVAALTGLSYAELSSMFPKASAEYEYIRKSFGKRIAFIIGWLIIFSGAIAGATVALGFAGYFNSLFSIPIIPMAIILIILLSFIIFYGIKQSAGVAIILTIIEALGLFIIIYIGLPFLGKINYFDTPKIDGIFSASALIFFAFIGFEEIVKLSEETKNPKRTIPRALILSIIITTIIYIFVSVSAVSVLGWQRLSKSSAPLADVASVAFGSNAFMIISIAALFSTTNTVLLVLLASTRITYGMAKSCSLPKKLSLIHKKRRTPWTAIILIALISILFIFTDIEIAASVTDFTIFVTFIIINASVIILRYKEPKTRRIFKVPIHIGKMPILPIFGSIFSFLLLVSLKFDAILYGLVLLFTGFIVYELMLLKKENNAKV
ncbi:MAG: APC family permease [Candidatus Aenigmatarchaeota archaeon]